MFLHGVGCDHLSWLPQLRSFGAAWRAIAWDMPGYGASPSLPAMTFPALAEALVVLFDGLGLDRVHLVGHSIGGMIAQELAATRPERLRTLVLSATSPAFGRPDGDWQQEFVRRRLAPIEAGRSMAEIAREAVPGLVGPGAADAGVALAVASMGLVPPESFAAAIRMIVGFDRRDALSRIAVPTLVLAGGADTNAPAAMMEKMAARIPGARYVCLDAVGHLANLEAPDRFDAAVMGFLAGHREG